MKRTSEVDLWRLTARERGMSEADLNRRLRKLADLHRFCRSLSRSGKTIGIKESRARYGRANESIEGK